MVVLVGVRRQEASSRSQKVDQNGAVGAVQVQARVQKTAKPRDLCVIPNTPERKRPRQSAGKYRGTKMISLLL